MQDSEPGRSAGEPGWLPFIGGLGGLVVGAAIGWFVARDDGQDTAAALAAIGGFMGLVLAFVPLASRRRAEKPPNADGHRAEHPLWSRRPSTMRIPQGGLATRPVPNRNAEPTGHVAGGREVTIVRRSGKWARIADDDDAEPTWVERGDLEPPTSHGEHARP